MSNRRDFLKTAAAATAGFYVGGRGFSAAAQAPAARRQVTIGGKRVRVIDVHAHWDMPLGDVVKGTPYEKEYSTGAGLEDRLAIMDKMAIDMAAISVNDFWWWDIADQGLARA